MKKKIIFLTLPAYAHINPTLRIARELIRIGHEVVIYNTEEFSSKIQEIGAEFRPPPFSIKPVDIRVARNPFKLAKLSLYVTKLATPLITEIINKEKPDCLIHDSLSLWGKVSAQKTQIPAITIVPTMAFNLEVFLSASKYILPEILQIIQHPLITRRIIQEYRSVYKEIKTNPPFILDLFANRENLNIVLTSEYLQPRRGSFDSRYKFVGPIIYERKEDSLPENYSQGEKPIIFVSLGTVYNENLLFFKTIINSLKHTPYQVLISIGKYIKASDLGAIPNNILVKNYFPQLEILKPTSVFISHAGMNSVNESLYYGVPMLLFPQIQEQRINASRVEQLGAGIFYKGKIIEGKCLLNFINKVLSDKTYRENARKIGETLKSAGGYKRAVEHIINYIS